MLQRIVPNAERVRFANTGTEAMMAAIRLARGVTGRPKILKFEGHYHGWHDDLLVSSNVLPPSSSGACARSRSRFPTALGLNRTALDDTIVVPWNDLPALQRAVENHPGQIAAIITEGIMANMGVIPPAEGYLQGLQELARANGILFILDETVTGFRIAPGGCQEYYKLVAGPGDIRQGSWMRLAGGGAGGPRGNHGCAAVGRRAALRHAQRIAHRNVCGAGQSARA